MNEEHTRKSAAEMNHMALGLAVGLILGMLLGNLALGMILGIAVGGLLDIWDENNSAEPLE